MSRLVFFIIAFTFLNTQLSSSDILDFLKSELPEANIKILEVSDHFTEEYEILIPQMVDHNDPKAGVFNHRVFLSHYKKEAPILMVTEGYSARDVCYEIARKIKSNQLIVEYRYYGKSIPENKEWKYLNNKQATKDLHRIHVLFSKFYKNKNWITTGISKGGTTCMFYKAAYPKDSRITVPYVGPMPLSATDERCDTHLKNIGNESCRKKLIALQKRILDQREFIVPKIDSLAKKNKMDFSMGKEMALEYAVLELSFSFWQYAHECNEIPSEASPNANFQYLNSVSGFSLYSDKTRAYYEPAFYQFVTENGYYGFVNEHLVDKIKHVKKFDNSFFAPSNVDLTYRPKYMLKAIKKLKREKRILQIHGALDPWAACGLVLEGRDQYYFVKKEGSHVTRIASFSDENQNYIWNIIKSWMK